MHLFGKKSNQNLLDFHVETSITNISGFVGSPESARKKGCHQFFFVNGRYMRHPYFHKAVQEAFAKLIPENEQVSYFIYFDLDPAKIDVNIHPTKTEIKFEDEHAIWQILVASIKEVLGRTHAIPSIDFDTADKPDIPIMTRERNVPPPKPDLHTNYNPFQTNREIPDRRPSIDWEKLYGTTSSGKDLTDNNPFGGHSQASFPSGSDSSEGRRPTNEFFGSSPWENSSSGNGPNENTISPSSDASKEQQVLFSHETERLGQEFDCIQFLGQYIITPIDSGLMLIEQHRAHVRILYDKYLHQLQSKHGVSQGMLFPEMIQISPSEAIQMDLLLNDFSFLGFDISNMGGGSFSIQGIPPGIDGLDPCRLVIEMLSSAIEKKDNVKSDIQSSMALTMSRSAAIVVGQILSNEEMNSIVSELLACSMPNYTPDGKKIISIIDEQDLSKLFS